ncbi:MAG: L-rhamnose mutarotase [Chloroflexi bacterium]|nr:L-rhamnose mutarotase [Chloroflexota bacterium]
MKSYGLTLQLVDDPEKIAEYKRQHQAVWPGVLARLREVGIERMQIFFVGTTLFMYVDTTDEFDPVRDFDRVNDDPESKRWNEWMAATFQQRDPHAKPGEWWALMERVFDTDWPQHRAP